MCLDGRLEEVLMDKITSRIENLCDGLNMDFIDPVIKHLILLIKLIILGFFFLFGFIKLANKYLISL